LRFPTVPPTSRIYRMLAQLPPGPVVEFPYFSRREDVFGHSSYMLRSTAHWHRLINGYSDFLPAGFLDEARTIAEFPRAEAIHLLQARGARYVVIHFAEFGDGGGDMRARLSAIIPSLRLLAHLGTDYLYELVQDVESADVTFGPRGWSANDLRRTEKTVPKPYPVSVGNGVARG